jgi:hypothetical protein
VATTLSRSVKSVIQALCEDTNTPRSLTIFMMVEAGEYGQLLNLRADPTHYLDGLSFYKDNIVTEFLRKFKIDVPGIDRSKVAEQAFFACEAQCYLSNRRFRNFNLGGPFTDPKELRQFAFLQSVRKKVSAILGPLPKGMDMRFGPGATFEDRSKLTTIPDKMSSRPTITQDARDFLPIWRETAWARALIDCYPRHSDPKTIRGNRFTTVPKDGLKDRGICIEPSLNVGFQLSIGRYLKERLEIAGINLRIGQDLHRSRAAWGSRTGLFATIDLSNASDTVSLELVRCLLPSNWFDLLFSLRSPKTLLKGQWYRLEKFSSMGNGFTFELETLIFAALAEACADEMNTGFSLGREILVYGDDIIVPTKLAEAVVACLKFCGFTPNPRKTFLTGSFRESCGGDYFDGLPVRAYNLEEDPYEPQHFIALANGIRRLASCHPSAPYLHRLVRRCWYKCLDNIPYVIRRLRGPVSTGDLTIHDDQWTCRETPDGQGSVRAYSPVGRPLGWEHWKSEIVLASALYGCYSTGPNSRGQEMSYRIKWVSVLDRPPS